MSSSLRRAFSFHAGLRKRRIGILLIAAFTITTALAFGNLGAFASGGPDVVKIVGTNSSPAGHSTPNGEEQNWDLDSAVVSGATFTVNVSVSIDVNGNTAVPYPRTVNLGQGPGGNGGSLGAISDCVYTSSATACTRTLTITAPVAPGAYLTKVDVTGGASPQSGLLPGNGLNIHYRVAAPTVDCNPVDTSLSVDAVHVVYHQPSATLSATLTRTSDQTGLAGQTIRFDIDGNPVGTGTTDSNGTATYILDTSLIPVGDYTINAFFDGVPCQFNATSGSATLCVTYGSVTFKPPIDPNGPALFRSVKTIPVKIVITDYYGIVVTDAEAFVFFAKYSSSTATDTDAEADPLANTNGDNGNKMRYSDGQYIFNWLTTGLTDGKYRITIVLGEGSCAPPRTADVTFKRK